MQCVPSHAIALQVNIFKDPFEKWFFKFLYNYRYLKNSYTNSMYMIFLYQDVTLRTVVSPLDIVYSEILIIVSLHREKRRKFQWGMKKLMIVMMQLWQRKLNQVWMAKSNNISCRITFLKCVLFIQMCTNTSRL